MDISYSMIAKLYDLIDVFYFRKKEKSPRQAVLAHMPEKPIKVLEMCAGTATNSILIAQNKKDAEVYGIDLSREMLNIANQKIEKLGLKNVKTYVKDVTCTEFEEQTFDRVLISLVLHEISEQLSDKLLAEARRVLKKEGIIIVVEWEQPRGFFKKMMFLFICLIEPKGFKDFLNKNFEHYFNSKGLYIQKVEHCDYTRIFELRK